MYLCEDIFRIVLTCAEQSTGHGYFLRGTTEPTKTSFQLTNLPNVGLVLHADQLLYCKKEKG